MTDVPTLTLCRWLNVCTTVLTLAIATWFYGMWLLIFRDSWPLVATAGLAMFPVRWIGDRIDAELRCRQAMHREGLL